MKVRTRNRFPKIKLLALLVLGWHSAQATGQDGGESNETAQGVRTESVQGLRVGTAAVEFEADDSMVIAGGITPGKAGGQEGTLRAVAIVIEKPPAGKLAIVACDILMITREWLDPAVAEIEKATGIPSSRILINCTHTHHAPSTLMVHGYGADETFARRVQRGIVQAVIDANAALSKDDCQFLFHLSHEKLWDRTAASCCPMDKSIGLDLGTSSCALPVHLIRNCRFWRFAIPRVSFEPQFSIIPPTRLDWVSSRSGCSQARGVPGLDWVSQLCRTRNRRANC